MTPKALSSAGAGRHERDRGRHASRLLPDVWGLDPLISALFLVAYVSLEWVSFIHEYKGIPITPWNPGLGVVFALMTFAGPRYGAVLLAGMVISEIAVIRSSLEWWVIAGIAAIFALVYALTAAAARRWFHLDAGLDLPRCDRAVQSRSGDSEDARLAGHQRRLAVPLRRR